MSRVQRQLGVSILMAVILGACSSSASDPVAIAPESPLGSAGTTLMIEEEIEDGRLGLFPTVTFSGEIERLPLGNANTERLTGFWRVGGESIFVRQQTDLQIEDPAVGNSITVTVRQRGGSLQIATLILPLDGFIEAMDGDLSDDPAVPTVIPVDNGSNRITATQQGEPRDIDFFTITVPEGSVLSAVLVQDYQAEPGNEAFIGLQSGDVFTVDPLRPLLGLPDLLGGLVFGSDQVNTDILQRIGALFGAIGFSGDLPSGDYTFWLNQTGAASTYTLDLQITPVDE